jgi:predicted ATP-dependent endonuclease of OLD family
VEFKAVKLKKVQIKNFRSIEELVVNFAHNCQILVGPNEGGKSNILSALNLLDTNVEILPSDKRVLLSSEAYDAKYFIRYFIEPSEDFYEDCEHAVRGKIIAKSDNPYLFTVDGIKKDISNSFKSLFKEILYVVHIKEDVRNYSYWKDAGYEFQSSKGVACNLVSGWSVPSSKCPEDFSIETTAGESKLLKELVLVRKEDFSSVPSEFLEDASSENIFKVFGKIINDTHKEYHKVITYWEYSDKFCLPPKLSINEFKSNPYSYVPVYRMFQLAGIRKITKAIDEAEQTEKGIQQLLDRVSTKTTEHIKGAWKEFKNLKIELSHNGEDISIGIRDENIYDFEQRSDGFKRLVTFLLLISAHAKAYGLRGSLLIIDEPDIGLHPKGAKALLEELLKLARHFQIVFSTHSIFMIDKSEIGRHLLVSKKQEKTEAKRAQHSKYSDEDVIFNAFGASIFENLKKENLIFEGWRDKELFRAALKSQSKTTKEVRKRLSKMGLCYSQGVKKIGEITAVMELAGRDCLIVSDNDGAAINAKAKHEKLNCHGAWSTYSDLDTECLALTGEDFVVVSRLTYAGKKLREEYPQLGAVPSKELFGVSERLEVLVNWIKLRERDKKLRDEIKSRMKDLIFVGIKSSHIEDTYFDLIPKILDKYPN